MSEPPPLKPSSPAPSGLDGTLNSLGLDWRYSDVGHPNLLYMLSAIDGLSVHHGKTLFNIHITCPSPPSSTPSTSHPSSPSTAQIELIEKEAVIRILPLSRLISCEAALTDPHTLQLVHLTPLPTASSRSRPPPSTSPQLLSLTFPSFDDAQDISALLKACIHSTQAFSLPPAPPTPNTAPSALPPHLAKTMHGQLCIHQGWIEKRSSTSPSYARRYLRLFPNRLLLYRHLTSPYPVNVLPLTVDDLDSHAVCTSSKPRQVELDLRHMWGMDGREGLKWRVSTVEEAARWQHAIHTEQTASFRTRVGAILTPALRAMLESGGGVGDTVGSRRGSLTAPPPIPPPPHPALTAVALSITASSRPTAPPVAPPIASSTSPRAAGSMSYAGNPLHDCSSSPQASPPLGASLFSTHPSLHLPALQLAGGGGPNPPLSLSSLLSSPRSFFHYLLHLSSLPVFTSTPLPTPVSWLRLTPQPFLKKRGKLMLAIDSSLTLYHHHLTSSLALWQEARLVMVDEMEQSGSGQIGFSFPGFDSQVFDVGRLSVIACHQLFGSPHPLLFTRKDYESAIESSSPAKEMMQSSPDIQALYDRGQVDEARVLSYQAQRLVLHHCALAAHLKTRPALKANEVVAWSAVLPPTVSPPPYPRNHGILEEFTGTAYIVNPSLHTLQLMLQQTEGGGKWEGQTISSAPMSLQGSPNGSPLSSVPSSPRGGARRGLKELWHARRGSDSTPKVAGEGKVGEGERERRGSHQGLPRGMPAPKGRVTPPTTRTSPSHTPPLHSPHPSMSPPPASPNLPSGGLPLPLSEEGVDVRPLVNPLHLLLLLRCLLQGRLQMIGGVEATCGEWWKKRKVERGGEGGGAEGKGERMEAVVSLMRRVEDEKGRAVAALAVLPSYEELGEQRELQEREDRDLLARNLLIKKRLAERGRGGGEGVERGVGTGVGAEGSKEEGEMAGKMVAGKGVEEEKQQGGGADGEEAPAGATSPLRSPVQGNVIRARMKQFERG